jgi:hypothetical protein
MSLAEDRSNIMGTMIGFVLKIEKIARIFGKDWNRNNKRAAIGRPTYIS